MITDNETNKVYFSNLSQIDFKNEINQFISLFNEYSIDFGFIKGTKDYYCRDYMCVQKDINSFIQFSFKPDYLQSAERKKFITNTKNLYKANQFLNDYTITYSDIVLDGGNIIRGTNKVIITDKLFKDNHSKSKTAIINEIEKLFNAMVILIPAYPQEETGHADGLIRFVDDTTVLTYNLEVESTLIGKKWKNDFLNVLNLNNLSVKMLPSISHKKDGNNWKYLNFLQVKDLIILPALNSADDEIMTDFFSTLFKTNIKSVNAKNISSHGGVFNCFSWNIKTN